MTLITTGIISSDVIYTTDLQSGFFNISICTLLSHVFGFENVLCMMCIVPSQPLIYN